MFCSFGTILTHQSNVRIFDLEQFLPQPCEVYLFKVNSKDKTIRQMDVTLISLLLILNRYFPNVNESLATFNRAFAAWAFKKQKTKQKQKQKTQPTVLLFDLPTV